MAAGKMLGVCSAVALSIAISSARAANILVNPGFESPSVTGGGNHIGTQPTGWTPNTGNNNAFNLVLDAPGAHDGGQYLDLTNGGSSITQTFTLATLSTVEFGSYFSPRDGGTGGGNVAIYDATNTTQLFAAPVVLAGPTYQWLLSTATTPPLPAGTYTFHINLDDPANTDSAFVNPTAVPEPAALSLAILSGVGLLGARRRRA
jgi:hypothetical protein